MWFWIIVAIVSIIAFALISAVWVWIAVRAAKRAEDKGVGDIDDPYDFGY